MLADLIKNQFDVQLRSEVYTHSSWSIFLWWIWIIRCSDYDSESIFFRNKKIIVNFIDYLNYTYKLKYIHAPTDWSNDWFPQRFAIIPTGHLTVPLIRVCLNWFLFGKDIMGKKNLITFDWNMSQLSSGEMFHRSFWTQNVRVCFLFLFWSLTYSFFHVFNSWFIIYCVFTGSIDSYLCFVFF